MRSNFESRWITSATSCEVRWIRIDDMLDAFRRQAARRHAKAAVEVEVEVEADELRVKSPRGDTDTI